jgi:membrane-associated phosphatidylinositol transfer protein
LFAFRNGAANHRANDVLVREGTPQVLSARFSYGPLDMAALSGERVDIHIMKEPPAGDWIFVSTEITDKAGRLNFRLPAQVWFFLV